MSMESDALDIDKYLPIKSSEEAENFCKNEDGFFEQWKKEAMKRVYAAGDIIYIYI